MWERVEDKLALLELLTQPALKRRAAQRDAFELLSELDWTRATGRRDELGLVPQHRASVLELMARVWPDWPDAHLALLEAGEPPTPAGWGRLMDQRRVDALSALPSRLNRRTAAAASAPSAKAALTSARVSALGEREVVDDGLIRVRAPAGLFVQRQGQRIALDEVQAVFDEVGISDRALRDGLTIEGPIHALMTVENLGAWRDMPQPPGWMLAHVPGWNTTTIRQLSTLIAGVPTLHFGDLDPNGLRIYQHLSEHIPGMVWFVPDFWEELVTLHAHEVVWPTNLDLSDAPPLVRALARRNKWLEQERLVLDPRLIPAMALARHPAQR